MKKALEAQSVRKGELLLHSDQGIQYTSKAFTDFCESEQITQNMSKAGYPYDNAPMERYFNTLKNEFDHYKPSTEQRPVAWLTKLSGISAASSKKTPARVIPWMRSCDRSSFPPKI